MGKRFALTGLIGLGLVGSGALLARGAMAAGGSATLAEASFARALAKRLPKTRATRIDCSIIPGLCEVQAGANLFYTDLSARYLVVGRVYDMDTRQDLTAARLLEINPDMLAGAGAASLQDDQTAAAAYAGDSGARPVSPAPPRQRRYSLLPLPAYPDPALSPGARVISVSRCSATSTADTASCCISSCRPWMCAWLNGRFRCWAPAWSPMR